METLKELLEKFKASTEISTLWPGVEISNLNSGRDEIIPGDDTFIYVGENGKFVFEDMHKEGVPSFEATADEMVDYYEGVSVAYGIDLKEDKSDFYRKGFGITTKSLLQSIKTN